MSSGAVSGHSIPPSVVALSCCVLVVCEDELAAGHCMSPGHGAGVCIIPAYADAVRASTSTVV